MQRRASMAVARARIGPRAREARDFGSVAARGGGEQARVARAFGGRRRELGLRGRRCNKRRCEATEQRERTRRMANSAMASMRDCPADRIDPLLVGDTRRDTVGTRSPVT